MQTKASAAVGTIAINARMTQTLGSPLHLCTPSPHVVCLLLFQGVPRVSSSLPLLPS